MIGNVETLAQAGIEITALNLEYAVLARKAVFWGAYLRIFNRAARKITAKRLDLAVHNVDDEAPEMQTARQIFRAVSEVPAMTPPVSRRKLA
jgi:hypothetical protein